MVYKLNKAANTRISKPINPDGFGITLSNYKSVTMPEDSSDVKKIVNTHDFKKYKNQRFKISSFEKIEKDFGNLYSFYLNKERISQNLDLHTHEITPIPNDWQDSSIIPTLQNGLDILIKNPGIFPTETINHYNKGKLGSFFTRLP